MDLDQIPFALGDSFNTSSITRFSNANCVLYSHFLHSRSNAITPLPFKALSWLASVVTRPGISIFAVAQFLRQGSAGSHFSNTMIGAALFCTFTSVSYPLKSFVHPPIGSNSLGVEGIELAVLVADHHRAMRNLRTGAIELGHVVSHSGDVPGLRSRIGEEVRDA